MQKSYLLWPYLKTLETTVTNTFKEEDAYFVELERTLFYPHYSGGQPEDRGTIAGIDVLHVRENNGTIQHQVAEEIEPGTVELEIDWPRRYDHMQQHTAQHIISGLFSQVYGIQTVGFMIGETVSTIDFDCLDRHNAKDIAEHVLKLANHLIQAGLPIHRNFETELSDAQKEKAKGAPLRTIYIPTLEKNECGGTHVAQTSEVGYVRMMKWQKDRNHYRMTYIAGNRCLNEYETFLDYAIKWAEEDQTSPLEIMKRMDDQRAKQSESKEKERQGLDYVKQAIQERLLNHKINYKGYTLVTDFVPSNWRLQDLAKGLPYDLVFFMNDDGQFYFEGKNNVPAVRAWMDHVLVDPNWKGGGRDGILNGRFSVDAPKEKYTDLLQALLHD